jgi:cell division protein ZapE
MTPLQRYQHDLEHKGFTPDAAQREAVGHTDALFHALCASPAGNVSLLGKLRRRLRGGRRDPIAGLYFWGGVGRGKTWLVDSFFDCLPFDEKLRMHFHRFMRHVHQELKALPDTEDPLRVVAARLAGRARVICFDEFHVSDITDAMLLGRLLETLFENGVTLVATSNQHPDSLYANGLQRERFLPAIALLHRHTRVINVDGGVDYRLRYLDQATIYHAPLDWQSNGLLQDHFDHLAPESGSRMANVSIEIDGRRIPVMRRADGVVWFDFPAICDGPRGATDYIEIARQFQTVLIGNVPRFDDSANDAARRFITLVDEFYDRNVRLVLTAAAPPGALYGGGRLAESFQRTASRLIEMQSHDYLAREHRST